MTLLAQFPLADAISSPVQVPVQSLRLAVMIPCLDEMTTIGQVVLGFSAALPEAEIYVYDNNSTDGTAEVAREFGAIVRRAPLLGKGNVVHRMFCDIDADVYVLVDGDNTYDCAAAPSMVSLLIAEGLDMVCAARDDNKREAYRAGHRFGNRLLTGCVDSIFGHQFDDMLTGYRVFSRRFVKSFPGTSAGFEIETELTVHALQMRLPVAEIRASYGARPDGSKSKLRTIRDGLKIIRMIVLLMREERPLQFFSLIASGLAFVCCLLGAASAAGIRPRRHSATYAEFDCIGGLWNFGPAKSGVRHDLRRGRARADRATPPRLSCVAGPVGTAASSTGY